MCQTIQHYANLEIHDCGLLQCDAASLVKLLATFRKSVRNTQQDKAAAKTSKFA